LSSNNILVWEIDTDEDEIRNDIDFNASQREKVQALGTLSNKNKSDIDALGKSIDRAHNSVTEVNIKQSDRILDKANRPSIINEKPWFDVEHVRDSLRFRTSIQEFDNVEAIFDLLQSSNIEFIKIDLLKMFSPKSFGWRCSVFDVFLNGQIVEHYHSFAGLFQVNKNVAHEIFERWRNCNEEETTEKFEEFREDLERSSAAFDEEWNKVLSRLKLTEDKAFNNWNAMAESIFQKITP
jgi:hypothetical protein